MATANDIISRAARRAKILAGEETMGSAEAVDALQLLNDMLHEFPARGIKYPHRTLAATDTVNVPDRMLRALTLVFVKELAIDYGISLDAATENEIAAAENRLQAYYLVVNPTAPERALKSRRLGAFDFDRGE